MKTSFLFPVIIALLFFTFSCQSPPSIDLELIKKEIMTTEEAFNQLAAEKGVKEAFLAFAADDAVLNRGPQMIKGKEAIANYFDQQTLQNVQLKWHPDFVDVSTSGDLGYTYGPFTFSAIDTSGQEITSEGYFHTVWKKQSDGSWKFVYD